MCYALIICVGIQWRTFTYIHIHIRICICGRAWQQFFFFSFRFMNINVLQWIHVLVWNFVTLSRYQCHDTSWKSRSTLVVNYFVRCYCCLHPYNIKCCSHWKLIKISVFLVSLIFFILIFSFITNDLYW